mmetsp:Transcript_61457/g.121644  ORF Transcript_61457/g.121644 Transcript_61457/m.121644 type:complete len:488 (+) Transcript_61457:73-1536(+)
MHYVVRQFVLQHGKAIGTKEAVVKYERYMAENDLAQLQHTWLFYDKYHPRSLLRFHDQRIHSCKRSADIFLHHLKDGRFSGLCLSQQQANHLDTRCITCSSEAPHFLLDPDTNTIVLSNIPTTVSFWDIFEALSQSCPGVLIANWSHPPAADQQQRQQKQMREMRILFDSRNQAQAALDSLDNFPSVGPVGWSTMRPTLAAESDISAATLPVEMSYPLQILMDEELSSRLVTHLDCIIGLGHKTAEALLGCCRSPQEQLDLNVLYLRQVHNFCFYSGIWCKDPWELKDRCGLQILRSGSGEIAQAVSCTASVAARAHKQRLERFLEEVQCDNLMPLAPSDGWLTNFMEENIKKHSEAKFQCMACMAYFRGKECMQKHISEAHLALLTKAREEVFMVEARANYLCEGWLTEFMEENMKQHSEAKFQCMACKKYFRGQECMQKHISEAHLDLLTEAREERYVAEALANYLREHARSDEGGNVNSNPTGP